MTATAPPAQATIGSFRWSICGLLFRSVALNYIDRNIIGTSGVFSPVEAVVPDRHAAAPAGGRALALGRV